MCPSECPNLINKYGKEFTEIYEKYESEGKFLRQVPARELWFRIMESQIETGVPYIVFKDAVNYKSNQINIGVVNGSNLCVSGDTKILTSKGYMNIKKASKEKHVKVWNGEEFSKVSVKKTGTNQDMMEIEFSNGSILKCTPYHKFYTTTSSRGKITKKKASELEIGDKLIKTEYPVIEEGSDDFKYPYTHGLFSANGTYEKSKNKAQQCGFNHLPGEKYCKRHIDHAQTINKEKVTNKKQCHMLIIH
jgi:ribonucleoside-diphosphate reductase alpha chain